MLRRLFLLALLLIPLVIDAAESQRVALVSATTTTGAGAAVNMGRTALSDRPGVVENTPFRTFHAYGTTSAGSGAATIKVQVNAGGTSSWVDACTITLTLGTAVTSDGCAMSAGWPLVRGNVTALSGTTATVSLDMGL